MLTLEEQFFMAASDEELEKASIDTALLLLDEERLTMREGDPVQEWDCLYDCDSSPETGQYWGLY